MISMKQITWNEIIDRLKSFDRSKKYYGVPRGGAYLSAMLNPVDHPEEADIIIDDIIDSGETMIRFSTLYPDKPFIGLIDKQKENITEWIALPWEKQDQSELESNAKRIIQCFDDANREGLRDTPRRYIKFLREFMTPAPFNFTTFDGEGMNQMIVQRDIEFHSLCEHHLAPFFGVGHIAYIPDRKIVGLSKLARCLDSYARGFQNQERITNQVADRLMEELNPVGVAVVIEAHHTCMSMRGIKKQGAMTTTSAMKGVFKDDMNARNEFLKLIGK